jgi:hypothetical protein
MPDIAGETDKSTIRQLLADGWEDLNTLNALLTINPAVTEGLFRDPRRQ